MTTTTPKIKPIRYLAVCAGCNSRKEVQVMPVEGEAWPVCDKCSEAMSVVGTTNPAKEEA
jgi:hypothetical protein